MSQQVTTTGGTAGEVVWAALDRALAIAEFSVEGALLRANAPYLALLGYVGQDVQGCHHQAFCCAKAMDAPSHARFWQRLQAGEVVAGPGQRVTGDGRIVWLDTVCSPVTNAAGEVVRIVEVATGTSARERRRTPRVARLSASARRRRPEGGGTDPLTGLANRQWWLSQARQAVALADGHAMPLAVLYIDIDGFWQINTALGNAGGDGLLRLMAARLRGALRASDIVGRLGGDTFAVVLPDCDAARAAEVAGRLQVLLSAPCQIGEATITPSLRIGASLWPSDANAFDMLLQHADGALRQAKAAGPGQLRFYGAGLDAGGQARLSLELALRDAVRHGQLQLHYQPQVSLEGGEVYGVEALARWHHPHWGDISPARFIPLAESCGLIGALGQWAVREACRQLGDWRLRGIGVPSVSVNLSPTSFMDRALPGMIVDALQTHALPPEALRVEITESVLLDRNPNTIHTIHAVHAQGVRLSIDDFGTGYSSLGYLRQLPLSELKLDKSLVDDLVDDATSRALSQAVLSIGKSLQLTVVAEGVEGAPQQQLLREQGYHVAQGYLFARPLAAPALEQWLSDFDTGRAAA